MDQSEFRLVAQLYQPRKRFHDDGENFDTEHSPVRDSSIALRVDSDRFVEGITGSCALLDAAVGSELVWPPPLHRTTTEWNLEPRPHDTPSLGVGGLMWPNIYTAIAYQIGVEIGPRALETEQKLGLLPAQPDGMRAVASAFGPDILMHGANGLGCGPLNITPLPEPKLDRYDSNGEQIPPEWKDGCPWWGEGRNPSDMTEHSDTWYWEYQKSVRDVAKVVTPELVAAVWQQNRGLREDVTEFVSGGIGDKFALEWALRRGSQYEQAQQVADASVTDHHRNVGIDLSL